MNLRVDRDLLLEFFLTFSRFEFALKTTGLFKQHTVPPPGVFKAERDWDTFAVSLRTSFHSNASRELEEACDYLLTSPPNQQVIALNNVAWETPTRSNGETDVEFLLRMVRSVRNNLFHGGKYSNAPHEDTERTQLLLSHSMRVLCACLQLAPAQRAAFEDAIL